MSAAEATNPSPSTSALPGRSVLVTGAAGYIGSLVVGELSHRIEAGEITDTKVVAVDIRIVPEEKRKPRIVYEAMDIRSAEIPSLIQRHRTDTVVHLASIVTPGKQSNREFEYSVDVLGTKNVIDACVRHGVKKLIVTSSGAAYGYHADNPAWLTESDPVRGNEEFAYSDHKRIVEEMLAKYRASNPGLRQVVFRIGTILGDTVSNQITALFEKPVILLVGGSPSPFVFIWDRDVVDCIVHAIVTDRDGIFNVAGDGALTMKEIARLLGKPTVEIPAFVLELGLMALKRFGLTRYGPEQVNFLRYRPVLDNTRLKSEFGYLPRKTSREVFIAYRDRVLSKRAGMIDRISGLFRK